MRILVLGGTRFVGRHVVALLSSSGHDVTVFHRGETEADPPEGVHHVHGDFADFRRHLGALSATSPEVVLDMVPYLDKDGHGVMHFREVAHRAVVISSCDVYRAYGRLHRTEPGPPDPVPLTEDSPLRSVRADEVDDEGIDYDNFELEQAVRRIPELPVTILRLPATYGPGDYLHRLFPYLRRIDDERPAILLEARQAAWHWPRGYVENVAAAIALAVQDERASGRIYNVVEECPTQEEWVRQIGAAAGGKGEIVVVPAELLPETLRPRVDLTQDFVLDSSRIRSELGFAEIVSRSEGLRRTIDWERVNEPEASGPPDYEVEDEVLVLRNVRDAR